jgi:hypothetical protein
MRRPEICDLGATVAKIRDRNPLAPTVRPQFIVGMLAPTSGVQGRGEIGAALSWGSRAALFYHPFRFANRNILLGAAFTPDPRLSV